MKKFASTYVFGIIVAVFAIYTYFFEFKKAEEEKIKETEGTKLVKNLREEELTEMHFKKGDHEIFLTKKDGTWYLQKPLQEAADKITIENIVMSLAGEKEEELKLETGTKPNLKTYGLENPSDFVEIKMGDKSQKYLISTEKTYDNRQYNMVKVGDPKIYLASTSFAELADKPVKELRSKDLLGDVTALKFRLQYKGARPVEFVRKDGAWTYPANKDIKLDPKSFEDWTLALRYIKAREFVSEKPAAADFRKYGLDKPKLKVNLYVEHKAGEKMETKEIEFLSSEEKDGKVYFYTNVRPIIVEVTPIMMKPVEKSFDDFRDRKFPFTFDQKLVTKVQVQKSKVNLTVEKAEPNWKLTQGAEAGALDSDQVTSLIGKVRDLSADRFVSDKVFQPKNKIQFSDAAGKSILELAWADGFKEGNDSFSYLKSNLSKEVLAVRSNKLDELPVEKLIKPKEKTP